MPQTLKKLEAIDASPPLDIIETYANLPYTLQTAMCEFIDNSVASFESQISKSLPSFRHDSVKTKEIIVIFELEAGRIIVWDNAYGIVNEDLYRAIRLKVPPQDGRGLSEFGMGLKTAAFWLARGFEIDTKSVLENRGVKIVINAKTLAEHKGMIKPVYSDDTRKKWDLDPHGTVVTISDLRRITFTNKEIDECVRGFASRYRKWISNEGIKIRVYRRNELGQLVDVVHRYNHNVRTKSNVVAENLREGEILAYKPPEIKIDPQTGKLLETEFILTFNFEDRAFSIPSHLFLRDAGSREEAGVDLFRRGKIIQEKFTGFSAISDQSSFEYQRVNGELYLEDFKVTHTKDKFIWDGGLFEALDYAFKIHPEVKRMVAKARELRYRSQITTKESARSTKDFRKNQPLVELTYASDDEIIEIARKSDIVFNSSTDLIFKYLPAWSMEEITFFSRLESGKKMKSWIEIEQASKFTYIIYVNVTDPFISFFTPPGVPTTTFINSMRKMSLYWAMAELDTQKLMRGIPDFRKRLSELIEMHGSLEDKELQEDV